MSVNMSEIKRIADELRGLEPLLESTEIGINLKNKTDPEGAYQAEDYARWMGNDTGELQAAFDRLALYERALPALLDAIGWLMDNAVMLPCKVGDKVYEPTSRGTISAYEVISVHVSNCSVLIGWNLLEGFYSNVNGFEVSALGKTVFLTRAEAEAAIAQEKQKPRVDPHDIIYYGGDIELGVIGGTGAYINYPTDNQGTACEAAQREGAKG
jgi:hypothetical protein